MCKERRIGEVQASIEQLCDSIRTISALSQTTPHRAFTHIKSSMHAGQRRLNVHGAAILNEGSEAPEGLKFGLHGVEKGSGENVHALHVGELRCVVVVSVVCA